MTDSSYASNAQGSVSNEATQMLQNFWTSVTSDIRAIKYDHFKTQELPLARIKKIMKLDEDVKMISAEAPVLFSKACEIFISELSLRSWIHTEDNKRRTLQRNDIAMAITKFDQFDFLIDIVPREDIKSAKRQDETQASVLPDQIQYYLQLAQQQTQQQQAQSVQVQTIALAQNVTIPSSGAQIHLAGAQIIQQPFQVAPAQTIPVSVQQQQQQTQVFQQVVTPSGTVENVPIRLTPHQLQAIQMQLQGKTLNQPIIIQTSSAAPPHHAQTVASQTDYFSTNQGVFQLQCVQGLGHQVYIQQDTDQNDS